MAVVKLNASAICFQWVPCQNTFRHWLHSQNLSSQANVRGGTRLSTCLLGHFDQLSAAGHAAGLTEGEPQFVEDETKLFQGTQATWNEKGGLNTIAD